jgi:hypothetical protein
MTIPSIDQQNEILPSPSDKEKKEFRASKFRGNRDLIQTLDLYV